MLVAFCDQVAGNSTSFCSNPPTDAVRFSQTTSSNGCVPSVVNRREIDNP